MKGYIDLHLHTTASDGSFMPAELVRYAKEKGLCAIAITDHDTVKGIPEALIEAEKVGIKLIPGIEIGADFEREMHLLGYFTPDNYQNIIPVLDELKAARDERNPKMIQKLCEMGFDITMAEVNNEAGGDIIARPHFAKVLVKKGYVRDNNEAFTRYIGDGKPAYVKKAKLKPSEAISEILKAGGFPVLAHPIHLGLSYRSLDIVVGELVQAGLKGIEAIYVDNTEQDTGKLLRMAISHKIIATGGSDFHGLFKHGIDVGVGRGNLKIPYEIIDQMGL